MRPDKRNTNDIRVTHTALGQLHRADGSGRYQFGDSSVLCGIYGPAAIGLRDEKLDRAVIEVSFSAAHGKSTTRERLHERLLRSTFETAILSALHPRTGIRITCQTLCDDGAVLATSINATMLALMDAGIPLRSVITAVSCMVDKEGEVFLDPTALELKEAQSTHTFAFDNVSGGVVSCESTGVFTEEEYESCYDICKQGSDAIERFLRHALQKKLEKQSGLDFGKS
ncbi:Exosome component 5 [Rhizophlyctis rosea]|uniref:Exosome component 5 n=1 Tax=Rhizophlyctis rosea TaxID=64517 RepID=A0AAD5SGD5_9FUNG|nr:Exosome component 5 [Rhizophlyctis rosea]